MQIFSEPIFWLSLALFFLIIEFSGIGQLYATLFSIGAFLSLLFSFLTDNSTILIVVFFVTTIVSLKFIKPILDDRFQINKTIVESNINSIIGKQGKVVKQLTRVDKGRITVENEEWSALLKFDGKANEGDIVKVIKVTGATLIVELLNSEESA